MGCCQYLYISKSSWKEKPHKVNDAEEITLRSGESAEPRGNAGAGGKGGYGGRSGTVRLSQFDNGFYHPRPLKPLPFFVREAEGQKGKDGTHGSPGRGGSNRTVYEGTYIHKKRNLWELSKRVMAEGATGAGATSTIAPLAARIGSLGGPIGSAIGYVGTVGAGAIVGGVAGIVSPIIGTEIDKSLPEWSKKPDVLVQETRASDGKVPEHTNDDNIQNPEILNPIEYDKVSDYWRNCLAKRSL